MRIVTVKIANHKCYRRTSTLHFNEGLNVILGTNESGKTAILGALSISKSVLFLQFRFRFKIARHTSCLHLN
ncbi:AAA family ATPase [Rhizobium lusitanum]|uniref:AAA family ATPase n=1 Tax=Rhizobium lusitanum TaxID=293958 RepID=A0A6L9UIB5_9HYPH|nr:AAA family ATPase [Rhizobium lusitanum]